MRVRALGRHVCVVAAVAVLSGCGGDGDDEVTRAEFVEWLQNTEMVGPHDAEEAQCIADAMYDAGLTPSQAAEYLAEEGEPLTLDLYSESLSDCLFAAIEDSINDA